MIKELSRFLPCFYVENYGFKDNKFYLVLAVLDLHSSIDYRKMTPRIEEVFIYYDLLLGCGSYGTRQQVQYLFKAYARDDLRKKHLTREFLKAKQNLVHRVDLTRVGLMVPNLKLTETVFSGQKIIF